MLENNEQDQQLEKALAKFKDIPLDVLDLLFRAYDMNWGHISLISSEAMALAHKMPEEANYPHRDSVIETLHELIVFSHDMAKALGFHELCDVKESLEHYRKLIESNQ